MKIPPKLIAWPIAAVVMLLRWTCRLRVHNDPRPAMRERGERFAYAILHANQVAAAINTDPDTAAMVSRSGDGELMVQAFHALGVTPIRGSSQKDGKDRGGGAALDKLVEHVSGGSPAIIAVDGPRGPRGRVRKGIASLAQRADAAVVVVVLKPSARIRIKMAWDRFQTPLPFCRIDAYFAEPIRAQPGEGIEALRRRIEESLNALEREHDPAEAMAERRPQERAQKRAA